MIRFVCDDRSPELHFEKGLSGDEETSYGKIALVQRRGDGGSGEKWKESSGAAETTSGSQPREVLKYLSHV